MYLKREKGRWRVLLMTAALTVPLWGGAVTGVSSEEQDETVGWKKLDEDSPELSGMGASDYAKVAADWKQIILNRERSGNFYQMIPEGSDMAETSEQIESQSREELRNEPGETGIQVETGTQEGKAEYIFEDGDRRYLTEEEVHRLSAQGACYAKNEFYAKHGRKFLSQELREYFEEKSWYHGTVDPEAFDDTVFNEYEKANIILVQDWEYALCPDGGYSLDQEGYDIHSF